MYLIGLFLSLQINACRFLSLCCFFPDDAGDIVLSEDSSVFITSPGFPDPYPNQASELWTISATEEHGIVYVFDILDVEESFDTLTIGTGLDPSAGESVMQIYTGQIAPGTRFLNEYWMSWMKFESDFTGRGVGFLVSISSLHSSRKDHALLIRSFFIKGEVPQTIMYIG